MWVSTAVISGTKVLTQNASPGNTAAALTVILGTAIENCTVSQIDALRDALKRVPGGGNPSAVIGQLLI